jgi:hypothetical protein
MASIYPGIRHAFIPMYRLMDGREDRPTPSPVPLDLVGRLRSGAAKIEGVALKNDCVQCSALTDVDFLKREFMMARTRRAVSELVDFVQIQDCLPNRKLHYRSVPTVLER